MGATKSMCCAPDKVQRSTLPDSDKSNTSSKPRRAKRELYNEGDRELLSDSESFTNTSNLQSETSISTNLPFHTPAEQEEAHALFYNAVQSGKDFLVMHYDQDFPELDLLQTIFENGENVLHVAVRNKSPDLILYLLTNGVSPNAKNEKTGDTALHTAVRVGDVKIVTLLCKHGAIAQLHNHAKESPLDIASKMDNVDLLELLDPGVQRLVTEHISSPMNNAMKNGGNSGTMTPASEFSTDDEFGAYPLNTQRLGDVEMLGSEADLILAASPNRAAPLLTSQSVYPLGKKNKGQQNRHTIAGTGNSGGGLGDLQALKYSKTVPTTSGTHVVSGNISDYNINENDENPFGRLKRKQTKDVLMDMKSLSAAGKALPQLTGWLDRKSRLGSWKTQWVVVKKGFILWNHEPREIRNVKSRKERAKFKGNLNLMQIVEIERITTGKTQRKFTFTVGSGKERKEYLWRCGSEQDRNKWVDGLAQHQKHIKSVVSYLKSK